LAPVLADTRNTAKNPGLFTGNLHGFINRGLCIVTLAAAAYIDFYDIPALSGFNEQRHI
jgi:hypothetical protein